jgi:poly(3-hydroxybutyrate) depolymerase
MKRLALALALLAMTTLAIPVSADTTITGEKKGAFFTITVPDTWNGDLVISNHGFDFDAPEPAPGLGALASLWLSEGFAVAASSYSQCCWAVFNTKQDIERMVDVFKNEFGEPDRVFVSGGSLGGIVTAQVVEKLQDDLNIVGAYPVCGALSGSRGWDGGIDLRLTYDVICGGVAPIPGGATGLPAPGHPASPFSILDTLLSTNACLGVPFGGGLPGAAARLAQFVSATSLPVSFVAGDMVFSTHGVSNVIFEAGKLDGGQGMSNEGVVYSDPAVDAAIERVIPDRQARKKLQRNFTPKGDVGDTKIVSIHTDGDGLVIVEQEQPYRDIVPASNLTIGIVDEAGNTHCGFTEAEIVSGWESLRAWVDGAPQPSPTDIQNTCLALQNLGATGPCRFDPSFVIPSMDGRVPPR